MFEDLTNLGIDELLEEAQIAKSAKDGWADYYKRVTDEIVFRKNDDIQKALQAKDDPFGTVHVDGLKFTVPKTVIWDQEKLGGLYHEIANGGENPTDYMAVNYKVREAAFKNWPKSIQDAFIAARTVKAGSIKVEIGDTE